MDRGASNIWMDSLSGAGTLEIANNSRNNIYITTIEPTINVVNNGKGLVVLAGQVL